MKRLFDGYAKCAGVWARQAQDEGHTRGRRMFFHGRVIYSYGIHFPIARIVDGVVLLNDSTYSVTTTKHQHCVRASTLAVYGWENVVHVSTATLSALDTSGNAGVYREYAERIKTCLATARLPRKRHKTKLYLWGAAVHDMKACLRFARLRGESVPVILDDDDAAREYQLAVAMVELGK